MISVCVCVCTLYRVCATFMWSGLHIYIILFFFQLYILCHYQLTLVHSKYLCVCVCVYAA